MSLGNRSQSSVTLPGKAMLGTGKNKAIKDSIPNQGNYFSILLSFSSKV